MDVSPLRVEMQKNYNYPRSPEFLVAPVSDEIGAFFLAANSNDREKNLLYMPIGTMVYSMQYLFL
ncbi:hypothetical protein SAMN02745181_0905 [Rubritalea squalenifaciens DSM 18772]|uniref:Uncharacterized protein n=1 Tax=Rubritalea squalenifaciens DSM 18772 TaxID=1123071 RepID=A0A1M6E1S7_9BACT|nr:hypothetical protein SAMN02745181_0905 [Rubritalea squalenifaciens DSM 18772]